ncbi:hypothetical protein JW879_03465 [candidate division WOR-3 bacterium]|nr:hypothetical protein [candidate division WOR-3 bacterium]
MKEFFTEEEWEHLRLLPFLIFYVVASADGKIDDKELKSLYVWLKNWSCYKIPLIRELYYDIMHASEQSKQEFFSKSYELLYGSERHNLLYGSNAPRVRLHELLLESQMFLVKKLSRDEFLDFMEGLWLLAYEIANASGGFLGFGKKICKEEKKVLDSLVRVMHIDSGRYTKKAKKEPIWLSLLPPHLRPDDECVNKLENLRLKFSIPHKLLAMRVLGSSSMIKKTQMFSYRKYKSLNPGASEKELLRMVFQERLQTPPVIEMSKKKIDETMKKINSIEDLCNVVITMEEQEDKDFSFDSITDCFLALNNPSYKSNISYEDYMNLSESELIEKYPEDPLAIGKRIDKILAEGNK